MEYQNEKEFKKLMTLVRKLKPKSVLEIGSMFGDSLVEFIKASAKNAVIASVDFPLPKSDGRNVKQSDFHNNLSKEWASKYKRKVHVLPKNSHIQSTLEEVKKIFPDGIDFLFIDGDHTYEGVMHDYDMYSPLVSDGGMIGFHDMAGLEGPIRAWNELKNNGKSYKEIIETKDGWGIGIIYV